VLATRALWQWPRWRAQIPDEVSASSPLLVGLGTVGGERPNSFLKRRVDIAPGTRRRSPGGGAPALLDQGDLVLGISVCLLAVWVMPVWLAVVAFVAIALHAVLTSSVTESACAPPRCRFGPVSRVYVSLPLTGPAARAGRDVLRGTQLALEAANGAAVELVVLDGFGPDRDGQAIANARRAASDGQALAYVGDFHSSQVASTTPILAGAGLLQIAPVATYAGLRGDTLVRLTPHDGVGARAIAAWLAEHGVDDVLVVHDYGNEYGEPVGAMCAQAAREHGLAVRIRPVWDHDENPVADLGAARAVLYVGVAGSRAVGLWDALHGANPELWLLGSDGVAQSWFAREMAPGPARRTRFFVAQCAPMAFYGYEAMALVLDAIAVGAGERAATVRAARATRDRDSVLGRYSVDAEGHTTSAAYGRLAVVDGALVWDV